MDADAAQGSGGASGGTGGSPNAGSGGAGTGGAGQPDGGGGGVGGGGPVTGGTGGRVGTGGAGAVGGATGGAGAGGGGAAGAGGRPNPSGGNGGNSTPTACSRDLLKSTIDAYFKALAAHDVSSLPLAPDVKFTENGKVLKVGMEGLWRTAGALKYVQSALDTESCSSASHAVVPDGDLDIPVALRLKLQNQTLTEIETIAVRPGDYRVGGQPFASNTQAIIASRDTVRWEDPVPTAQRNTRDEIARWIDKYFRMFPRGVCNVTPDCRRLENGGGTFMCTTGASCDPGQPSGQPALTPRLILVDSETGIGVGFTMFMGNTDMHMYKMYGGRVYAVHAILGAATSSGWN